MSHYSIQQLTARVVSNEALAPETYRLTLQLQELPEGIRPGRFVMLRTSPHLDPLLRRAFSIHDFTGSTFAILYQVRGRGTRWMAVRAAGEEIDLIGPLGRGFDTNLPIKKALLIAGGIGIAPFHLLTRELQAKGVEVLLFYGARSAVDLVGLKELERIGVSAILATEDGSLGEKGRVTELFQENFRPVEPAEDFKIFACGPQAMLFEVARIAGRTGMACDVSLESNMACGLGTCMGCVIETESGYQRVCREGPVFSAKELVLSATGL
ncbi:MAG: dihydroorotate dehydrogenase electron transfer subunit [bacterium]|nr:dihydroorotate dehydrogenase electron transfer subunit [bacterium]